MMGWAFTLHAQHSSTVPDTRSRVDKSTDILCLLPATAGCLMMCVEKDVDGLKQFAFSAGTTLAANYLLEWSIRKKRPDGTGNHAFPSTHTAAAFMGASFLACRYGWKWGLPAYAVATYVAWGRVYAKKHDVWDVLAGAALGTGITWAFTRPLQTDKGLVLKVSPTLLDAGCPFNGYGLAATDLAGGVKVELVF